MLIGAQSVSKPETLVARMSADNGITWSSPANANVTTVFGDNANLMKDKNAGLSKVWTVARHFSTRF
jgi:hypothetical protein